MGRLPRRASKRLSLKQKYKIERKVKEHKKKVKKQAKLNPRSNKPKKDPGIPNMYPFKDELLRKIEDHRERVRQEKEAKKVQRKEKRQKDKEEGVKPNNNQQRSIQQLALDAYAQSKAFEIKEKAAAGFNTGLAMTGGKLTDASRRAYFKEFKKVITVADVVLQVLDARDPMGCRCVDIEQMILAKDPNKRIVLILNKIDLVPREVVEKWLKFLRNHYPTIAFKASTQSQRRNLGRTSGPIDINTSECLGADTLIKLLKNYAKNKGLKTTITVGIIGYPNVGKSSVINSLMRVKAVGVGATPGFTKTAQEVHLDKHVKLLDSPGIVFAADSTNPEVILRNCIKVEQIDDPVTPVEAILKRCKKQQLLLIYKIPVYNSSQEFLAHIAQKYGKLSKGGVPNYAAAAKIVLQDWNGGRIPYYTLPPADLPDVHVGAAIVQAWGKEFNVEQDDRKVFSHLKPLSDKFMELEGSVTMKQDSDFLAALGKDDNKDDDADDMDEDDDEDYDDEDEDDDDEEEDEDEDEDEIAMEEDAGQFTSSSSKGQNLKDASDKFNLQRNKQLKKQQKKEKKKGKRNSKNQKEEDSEDDEDQGADDDYNFKEDFVASDDEDDDAISEDD